MTTMRISSLVIKDEPPFLATFTVDYGYFRVPDWTLWVSRQGTGMAYARTPQGKSGKWAVVVSDWFQEQIAKAAIDAYNTETGGRLTFAPLPGKSAERAVARAVGEDVRQALRDEVRAMVG